MKTTSKRYVKLIALILCVMVAISFTSCSCSRAEFDFSALKYEGYNYEEIVAALDGYEQSIKNNNTAANINSNLLKAQDLILDVGLQYQLIRLEYQKDMKNPTSLIEYTKAEKHYNALTGIFYNLFALGLENESFASNYTAEYIAFVRSQSAMRDEKYNELTEKSSSIVTRYNSLLNETSVTDGGKKYDYEEINKSETSADIRNLWYKAYSDGAGDLLIELRDTNNELAKHIGASSYAELSYAEYERDYSPKEAENLHKYVKTHFNGMYGALSGDKMKTKAASGASAQRTDTSLPAAEDYNLKAEITQSALAHPVSTTRNTLKKYFKEVSSDMDSAFDYMDRCNLYVTTSGENAYTGAYTTMLATYDTPYIYQYLDPGSGDSGNLSTFVHEFGHFYSFYQNKYDTGSLDINEIQSQANEWLFTKYYSELFNNPNNLIKSMFASDVFFSIQMGCIMDELQQKVYSDLTIKNGSDVTALFESLLYEYGAYRELSSYDFKYWWANVPHTFSSPFYYISYAISALPSIEVYRISEGSDANRKTAVTTYNRIVNDVLKPDGITRTLSELLTYVGIKSPFTESTIIGLAGFIKGKYGI